MLEYILDNDTELFLYLHNLGATQWDAFWTFVTNKYSSIPLYMLLLFFTYKQYGLKNTLWILVGVSVLILITDQSSQFCKFYFKRLRPCHNDAVLQLMRLKEAHCGGKYSYFSAHAGNAVAVATFFSILLRKYYPYLLIILPIWALLVAYSRIYLGVHYPLDVITGIILGLLYALMTSKVILKILKNRRF